MFYARLGLAVLWTVTLAGVAFVGLSLGSKAGDHVMPRVWLGVVLRLLGIRVRRHGAAPLPTAARCVYVSNHTSILDGLALVVTTRHMPRFVGKREIGRLPVIGPMWTRLGHVLIDRDDPAQAYEELARVRRDRGDVYSFYFAPEGTRSRDGALGPFKRGAFVFARALGVAVVPVAVCGAAALWPPRSRRIHPGTVDIVFGAPIPVDDVDTACATARAWIAAELAARSR